MAGNFFQAKNKSSLIKRFKRKDNMVTISPAGKPLQERARKGYKMYYVIIDKKGRR